MNIETRSPANVEEAAALIRAARVAGTAVYPRGSNAKSSSGVDPDRPKPGVILEATKLDALIDFPARDMTITVQAGMTIETLQKHLAAEGLELPVDCGGTVGGSLATNRSGPRRTSRGTLRDYLIGIEFLDDEGKLIHAGGRVVKNVAGYDLMKMHVGAHGTLGFLTQATFKVFPKPECRAWTVFDLAAAELPAMLERMHTSSARPPIVEVLNANFVAARLADIAHAAGGGWIIAVGFEEKAVTVKHQQTVLADELRGSTIRDLRTLDGAAAEHLLTALSGVGIASAGVLPSRLADYLMHCSAAEPQLGLHAHAGSGVVHLHHDEAWSAARVAALKPTEGNFRTVLGEPIGAVRDLERELMRTLKSTLDPHNVFNPGVLFPIDSLVPAPRTAP